MKPSCDRTVSVLREIQYMQGLKRLCLILRANSMSMLDPTIIDIRAENFKEFRKVERMIVDCLLASSLSFIRVRV